MLEAQETPRHAEIEHEEAMAAAVTAGEEALTAALSEHERELAAATAAAAKQAAREMLQHAKAEHKLQAASAVEHKLQSAAMMEAAAADLADAVSTHDFAAAAHEQAIRELRLSHLAALSDAQGRHAAVVTEWEARLSAAESVLAVRREEPQQDQAGEAGERLGLAKAEHEAALQNLECNHSKAIADIQVRHVQAQVSARVRRAQAHKKMWRDVEPEPENAGKTGASWSKLTTTLT